MSCCQKAAVARVAARSKKCFSEQFFCVLSHSGGVVRRFCQGDRFFTQHAANKSQGKVATGAARSRAPIRTLIGGRV